MIVRPSPQRSGSDLSRRRIVLATTCGPGDRKTLAAVRSLSARGARVIVAGDRFFGQAYWSRGVWERVRVEHPNNGIEASVTSLIKQLREFRPDVLLPMSDCWTQACAAKLARIEAELCRTVVAAPDALATARDKLAATELARELDIPTPPTWALRNADDARSIAAGVKFPCVVKYRSGAGAEGMRIVDSVEDLQPPGPGARRDLAVDATTLVVQPLLAGKVHEVCALYRHGELRAALTQRRSLMYPSLGGAGIWNETTDNPQLVELADRLLRRLNWHGPAQVEFLVEQQTGTPRFIEINGRFWGTLGLAIAAGVDFPALASQMALDGDVEPPDGYRLGLEYRWPVPLGLVRALADDHPLAMLARFLKPSATLESDLRLADPLPTAAECWYAAAQALSSGRVLPKTLSRA